MLLHFSAVGVGSKKGEQSPSLKPLYEKSFRRSRSSQGLKLTSTSMIDITAIVHSFNASIIYTSFLEKSISVCHGIKGSYVTRTSTVSF